MAGRPKGQLERDMLASMREWTADRRQQFLTRADELHRTLKWVERRDRDVSPAELAELSREPDALFSESSQHGSGEPRTPALSAKEADTNQSD